jgi:hypothetical protein
MAPKTPLTYKHELRYNRTAVLLVARDTPGETHMGEKQSDCLCREETRLLERFEAWLALEVSQGDPSPNTLRSYIGSA